MEETDIIRVKDLSKSYHQKPVLEHFNVSVKKGTVFGLLGANGAGKSTCISCMLGVTKSDSGQTSILGMNPVRNRKKLFEQVGVQFQDANYQTEIRVEELCTETASLYKCPADWKQLLDIFGIGEKKKALVKSLPWRCRRSY
ncbi:MAG: ATP-binding cassette domain-containing protein [Lachnospiraceae bacterium]|nr:ATP-binding cassette domain-containing protein [Lachnospiraceae bacterium]